MNAPITSLKPTRAEWIREAFSTDSLSIHVAAPVGPHAIIAFDPEACRAWERLAHTVFPHLGKHALRKLISDETCSERMRLAINSVYALPLTPPLEQDPDDRFAPEPLEPWAAHLHFLYPNRVGNPTILNKQALLHLLLSPNTQEAATLSLSSRILDPSLLTLQTAQALAGFLEPMLGPASVLTVSSGWLTHNGSAPLHGLYDLMAFRKSSECSLVLQSALEQVTLPSGLAHGQSRLLNTRL